MDTSISREVFEEFRRLMESENNRLKEENDRQNHRIEILENSIQKLTDLAASTEKLAVNMENMLKVQEQQSKRLEQIENRDGNKWRKTMEDIGRIILFLFSSHATSEKEIPWGMEGQACKTVSRICVYR